MIPSLADTLATRLALPCTPIRSARCCMLAICGHASAQSATIKRDSGPREYLRNALSRLVAFIPARPPPRLSPRGAVWYLARFERTASLGWLNWGSCAPRRRDAGPRCLFTFYPDADCRVVTARLARATFPMRRAISRRGATLSRADIYFASCWR